MARVCPSACASLLSELVLLDPGWSERLAALASSRSGAAVSAEAISTRQRGLWDTPTPEQLTVAAVTRDAGYAGVRPSPVAVEAWAPPWRPMYLAWRTTWYPSQPADWAFDGEELAWYGPDAFDHAGAQTIQGRCLLSGSLTRSLRDSVDALYERLAHAAVDPQQDSAAQVQARSRDRDATRTLLDAVKQQLSSADLLAQSMTGFHGQLVQRDAAQHREADEPTRGMLGDVARAAPMPYGDDETGERFHPVRGGHARLRRAWIVDAFGQVFDVIHEQGQTDQSFVPLRGRGLAPGGDLQRTDTQMLPFAPRLIQPSRLVFRFPTGVTPVSGWLLPNHLDGSLMVSDDRGELLGALVPWHADTAGRAVRWEPAPGAGGNASTSAITDDVLRAVVESLCPPEEGSPTSEQMVPAFPDFLQAVDRTLWTTDPLGQRGDTTSVLLGRPIAVVRAQLWLELDGPALPDQQWQHTLTGTANTARTAGVTDLSFQVRLGLPGARSDGTVGFYVDGEDTFHSVLSTGPPSPHISWSGEGTWPQVPVRVLGETATSPEPLGVILLLDPRGSVTASTGIQPSKSLQLPRRFVDAPLANLDASFRVGPVLSGATAVRMPLPADIARGWSWIEKTGVQLTPEGRTDTWGEAVPVEATPAGSPLGEVPTRLREGWLQLSQVLDSTTRKGDS